MDSVYQQALNDLNKKMELSEREWSLDNINAAKSELSLDTKETTINVQVVGTNGKGTTAYYLYHILLAQGYNVGLFTSPHLVNITERISFNGNMISPDDFGKYYFLLFHLFTKHQLSYFEKLTLLAFMYFSNKNADIVVWETGLGGRFDATTAMNSKIVLFTAIAMDHMEYLGNSIEEIVAEKAYVLKNSDTSLSIPQTETVHSLLQKNADIYQKKLSFIPPVANIQLKETGTSFDYKREKYEITMIGKHYAQNVSLAMEASKLISNNLDHNLYVQTLQKIKPWAGRLQFIDDNTYGKLLLSCAHNEHSLDSDLEIIKELLLRKILDKNSWIIFASTRQRPADIYIEKILAIFSNIIVTKANDDFLIHPILLEKYSNKLLFMENKTEILSFIRTKSSKPIIVIGSIYLCGEILRLL